MRTSYEDTNVDSVGFYDNVLNRKRTEKLYDKCIEKYKKDIFSDTITRATIESILKCKEYFMECQDKGIKFVKRLRCKRNYCPYCNNKIKGRKYFEILNRIKGFNDKYLMFCLTLNGKNTEINVEKVKIEMEDNDKKFKKLLNMNIFKKIVRGYLKVTELTYISERNIFLPHLHIILFTIKGAYKHLREIKVKGLREKINLEWSKLKDMEGLNTELKKVGGTKIHKLERTISYLTTSKKKRLENLINVDETVLYVYFKSLRRKHLYVWGGKLVGKR